MQLISAFVATQRAALPKFHCGAELFLGEGSRKEREDTYMMYAFKGDGEARPK